MFKLKLQNGEALTKERIATCICCGNKVKVTNSTFNEGPYDFYGLPKGKEMEWFNKRVQFCPKCGYAYRNIEINNKNINDVTKEKAQIVLKENITETEKSLKAGVIFHSIPLEDLYLYYEFIGEKDKASLLRKKLIEDIKGYVRDVNNLNVTHVIESDNDAAISEIEWYRREGDFDTALLLCEEYKNMPDMPRVYDAPRDRSDYRKLLKIEKRMCKNGYSESAFNVITR